MKLASTVESMFMKYNSIALVGATGVFGQELISLINERDIPVRNLRLFASKDSAGEIYQIGPLEAVVEEIDLKKISECECVLVATQSEEVKKHLAALIEKNIPLVDLTGSLRNHGKGITSLNTTSIILSKVLKPIHKLSTIKRVTATVFQSVSSAGKSALDELWSQTLGVFNQKDIESEAFHHQIAFNCIPQIDVILGDGFSKEEDAISEDIKFYLQDKNIRSAVTAVRVPVFYGTAISIHLEQESQIFPDDLIKNLSAFKDITLYADSADYPMHMSVAGSNEVHIGRIRKDPSVDAGLVLWIAADNIRQQVLYAIESLQ